MTVARMFVPFITLFFLLISSSNAHTQGTIGVDVLTFDKILRRFHTVLVKFDDKYPFNGVQGEFQKLASQVVNSKDFVIAEVPVTDLDAKENYQFALEFKANKRDFPVYRLFLKDSRKPIEYTGDRSADDLRRFLLQHTNIWLGLPGTFELLDRLGREFFDAVSDNKTDTQDTLLRTARNYVKSLTNKEDIKSGEAFLKIMEAVGQQGTGFLQTEKRRVQNLLKGQASKEKKQELEHRENIILSFKSLKEPVNNTINVAEDKVVNAGEQSKEAVIGDKDL